MEGKREGRAAEPAEDNDSLLGKPYENGQGQHDGEGHLKNGVFQGGLQGRKHCLPRQNTIAANGPVSGNTTRKWG